MLEATPTIAILRSAFCHRNRTRFTRSILRARLEAIPFARFTVECQSQLEKQSKASRVRQSVTSLFGLTDEEARDSDEEEPVAETKE